MRLLFELKPDGDLSGSAFVRPSMRGIIIRSGKVAMIHSLKYDYYKFPGGGAEDGEDPVDTMIREVREESGLCVLRDTVREYGYVHRLQKGLYEDMFIQDNYYFLCDVVDTPGAQQLDDYEDDERFTLEFVSPGTAISANLHHDHGEKTNVPSFGVMLDREIRVLKLLIREGLLPDA